MGLFKIGITGGMGSGKSQVLKHLKTKGITTIDLDQLAFSNYRLNKWSLQNIQTSFGYQSCIYDKIVPDHVIGVNR